MRAWLLGRFKRGVRSLANGRTGERVLRLVSEEYAVAQASRATTAADAALRSTLEPRVLKGPFAGLRYPDHGAVGSAYWPKLLGAYETELAGAVEAFSTRGYTHVLDIGAAEGYYAVGLALRLPAAQVIAFEGTQAGQQMLRALAGANGVQDRVAVEGWCDLPALRRLGPTLPAGRTLVVCDAEASEYDLLDPRAVPEIAGWDLLIELHRRRAVGDPRDWVTRTFDATHRVTFIDPEPRITSHYPELQRVPAEFRAGVLFERTDPFGWALLEHRGRAA